MNGLKTDEDGDATGTIECGVEAAKHFAFAPGWRNLNHGSFGTYPLSIRKVLRKHQDDVEAQPDTWIRYTYPRLLTTARQAVSQYLHAPLETVVFIPNASTGINVVLRNLVFAEGEVILYAPTTYGAVEKTIDFIVETTPAQSEKVAYTLPASDEVIVAAFEKAILALRKTGKVARLAVFDTISSLPGRRLPFEKLTKLCREYKVLSCIDGAHGIGHIPLDLTELDPDFFFSNAHKWLYTPRPCAVLYVPERTQSLMRSTLPTSHGFVPRGKGEARSPLPPRTNGDSEFVHKFEFVASVDNSPYLCFAPALEWRSRITFDRLRGEEAVFAYCQQQAREAGKVVAEKLGTGILGDAVDLANLCNFANVRLPLSFRDDAGGDEGTAIKMAQWMSEALVEKHSTFMAFVFYDEAWWVRLSAQVYLTMGDFAWGAERLKEVCALAKRGDWKSG
ncbi:hypothetical protein LTR62_004317 [Meristemomyces frigidus]|uniref:Aminotransferase class V domain-containing protein n=1 Tax=Meristemomyces frigidus TaxID=1508187 RepID=A0AAN7TIG0_9PEZI|nr:hypothetical protein LTR62_004317 [Meristemomyces frigidus]